jgi:hypothetical protein
MIEITLGGWVVGDAGGVDVAAGVSGEVIEGCSDGEAEVEVCVGGGGEAGAAVEAPPLVDVELASVCDVGAVCPDCVSAIVDAPLSAGAAMVPARTSTRRKSLLTRAPPSPSSWISRVSGPWL